MSNLMAEMICRRLIRLHLLLDFGELKTGFIGDENELKGLVRHTR